MDMTVIFRCNADPRVFDLLKSIDEPVAIVGAVTADPVIEPRLQAMGFRLRLVERGNLADTTNSALEIVTTSFVLLVDSDCILCPGAIRRMYDLCEGADIVRPQVRFAHNSVGSRLASLVREFEYGDSSHIYEPGLLLRLPSVYDAMGKPLFNSLARWTPDGEFSSRVPDTGLRVKTDTEYSVIHDRVGFAQQLRCHFRYGLSDAACSVQNRRMSLASWLKSLPARYRRLLCAPMLTRTAVVFCDLAYMMGHFVGR